MTKKLTGKTALITGASAGIGAALARRYAQAGCNLVLVARRAERMAELGQQLEVAHSIRSRTIATDLSDPAAPTHLHQRLVEQDITVDILINNAGYGVPGKYLSVAWQKHRDFEQVMTVTVMHLCHLLMPAMVERGWGRVINIASLAGHMPGTEGHTCYAAVKAWMIKFSESLHFEYAGKGVTTTAICPGFTYSEFHDVTGTRDQVSRMNKRMWMSAEEVADQALKASEAGKIVHITGGLNRMIARAVRWLPPRAVYHLMSGQSKKFRKLD